MKKLICLSLRLFAALVITWTISSVQGYAQVAHVVSVGNFTFNPTQLNINAGDTVIWQNTEGSHNVNGTQTTFPSNRESFGNNVGVDWVYKYVFDKSGTYDYQCDPHVNEGMVGKIIVADNPGEDAKITVQFSGMTPHVGQEFIAYLKDATTKDYLDTIKLSEIASASFDIVFSDLETGVSYEIDFFADLNGNETYDAPPADHAWRLAVEALTGDLVIDFEHNTNFTDIFAVATSLETLKTSSGLMVFPNPAVDFVRLSFPGDPDGPVLLNLYHSSGSLLRQEIIPQGVESYLLDVSTFRQGYYLVEALTGRTKEVIRLVKQ